MERMEELEKGWGRYEARLSGRSGVRVGVGSNGWRPQDTGGKGSRPFDRGSRRQV